MGREQAYVDYDIDESKFKNSEAMNHYKKIFSVQCVTVEREVKLSVTSRILGFPESSNQEVGF
ncbi:uncharacterized protein Pyn_14952 [Prunus yedoensis var. nudiflora]|uniref:Uncharacterized protein n=1 Tax=Prunus yedoensis var. nudiflora TaxID=2094558 RepID=A0A314Y6W1_PRUYE|nr:uncharacterized protein Pyn_14952 [Prunus yedoensis var. nudiflora]